MRPFLQKLVSVMLLLVAFSVPLLAEKSTEEARLIRKAFLDIKHIPPSPEELNWYLCYNHKPYQAAIEWLVVQTNNIHLKSYLLSSTYTYSTFSKIDESTLDFIIKYQSGNINNSNEEANLLLVKLAVACGEDNISDTIDYLALCLMARTTNVSEINNLLRIFKKYPIEEKGYLAVLQELKSYKDFQFK